MTQVVDELLKCLPKRLYFLVFKLKFIPKQPELKYMCMYCPLMSELGLLKSRIRNSTSA